jgi:hypothetical protein
MGALVTVPKPLSPRDPRRPLSGWFDFVVRGWRPFSGWACGAVILVRGAVVPVVELARGEPTAPMDWVSLIALAGALGLARYRSIERREGVTV